MWTPQNWYRDARLEAESRPELYRGLADHWLKTLEGALPGVPRAEIVRRLQAENKKRLEAVPSFAKYPELRGMRQLQEAEWRGFRDGAGMNDEQMASHCGATFYYHRYIASGRAMTGCSYIYFATSDRGPILANNLDTVPEEPYSIPVWPAISEHLLIGTVSSGIFMDEESPEIFPVPVYKLVARYARNVQEGAEILERYKEFWGPANLILIDRDHGIAMVEKTARRIATRFSNDGFGFITAGTQEDDSLRDYVWERRNASLAPRGLSPDNCDDIPYWQSQDKRRELMNELLDEARREPTLEKLRSMIQFRDPERGLVAANGEPVRPGHPETGHIEHTIRTQIWLLAEGRCQWWARDNEKAIPSWENRKEDVVFDDVWLWQ